MGDIAKNMPVPPPGLMPEGELLHVFMPGGAGTGSARIDHFTSRDGMNLRSEPPALTAEETGESAGFGGLEVAAGSRIYRMIYTDLRGQGSVPALGLAESEDLLSWRRGPGDAPGPGDSWYQTEAAEGFEPVWGDPFVIYDRQAKLYRLFISARRRRGGKPEKRGCVASAVSADMKEWELLPPVCAPGRYPRMAAPMALEGGGKYHLLFHVIDEDGNVRLERAEADNAGGPYDLVEGEPVYCGRDVCARPAVFDGEDSLIFIHRTRPGANNPGAVMLPAALDFEEGRPAAVMHPRVRSRIGEIMFAICVELESREMMVRLLPRRGADFLFMAELDLKDAARAGLLFRTSITGKDNVTLWLDAERSLMSLHRGVRGDEIVSAPFKRAREGLFEISVVADGALASVFVDRNLVMSSPIPGRPAGGVGLAVDRGKVEFRDVELAALNRAW